MDSTNHRPLASDLANATQQELSEASGLRDLSEPGLDDLVADAVAAAPGSHVAHEMHYVPGRNQLMDRRRQQPPLLDIPRTKGLAHGP